MLGKLLDGPGVAAGGFMLVSVMSLGGTANEARRIWAESDCEEEYEYFGFNSCQGRGEIAAAIESIVAWSPDVIVLEHDLGEGLASSEFLQAVRKRRIFKGVFLVKDRDFNLRESLQRSKEAREGGGRSSEYSQTSGKKRPW